MRAYFFVNSWLSGIQKGIQVAHCVAEMADSAMVVESWAHDNPVGQGRRKAAREANPEFIKMHDAYCDWAKGEKTIIVLDGGGHNDLLDIFSIFEDDDDASAYAYAYFSEDDESLNGAWTCVGIIVPPKIYEAAKKIRESLPVPVRPELNGWELKLIDLINSKELAR